MSKIKTIIASLLCLLSINYAVAQQPIAGAELDMTGIAKVKSGAGQRVGVKKYSLFFPLDKKISRQESFSSAINIVSHRFDWRGQKQASEFFWLSVPIKYQQTRNNGYKLMLDLEPGLMTDINSVSENHLGLNFQAAVQKNFTKSSHAYWQLGVLANRKFGNYDLRPLAMMSWRSSATTRFQLGFPYSRVDMQLAKTVNTYAHVSPEGGVWRYTVKGQKKDSDMNYQSLRLGLGINFHWRAKAWVGAEVGQVRNAVVSATSNANTKIKAFLDNDKYWKLYADIRF